MTRTDQVSLLVPADAGEVFAALVDEQALLAWLPPADMTGRFEHFDMRPGGSYRLELTYRDPRPTLGKTRPGADVAEVRIVELVAGSHVVQAVDFDSDDPAFAGTMTMTWRVSAAEGGTLVELRADDVPRGISAEDHTTGMSSSLANLAAYLERNL